MVNCHPPYFGPFVVQRMGITSGGNTWEQVGYAGFGDDNNTWTYFDNGVTSFKNKLYVSTNNYETGGEIWQMTNLKNIYLPLVIK